MAFARFGRDSDVYVYDDGRGFVCERCPAVGSVYRCATAAEMADHLETFHRGRGDRVPQDAIADLRADAGA